MSGLGTRGAEKKYFDTTVVGDGSLLTAQVAIQLQAITAGVDYNAHTGRSIKVYKSEVLATLNYQKQSGALAGSKPGMGRVALVWDKGVYLGSVPVWSDIFADAKTGAVAGNEFSFPNIRNAARFTILAEKKFYLPSSTSNAGGQMTAVPQPYDVNVTPGVIEWNLNLAGKSLLSTFNAAAVGHTGKLYIVPYCNASSFAALTWFHRCTFDNTGML